MNEELENLQTANYYLEDAIRMLQRGMRYGMSSASKFILGSYLKEVIQHVTASAEELGITLLPEEKAK